VRDAQPLDPVTGVARLGSVCFPTARCFRRDAIQGRPSHLIAGGTNEFANRYPAQNREEPGQRRYFAFVGSFENDGVTITNDVYAAIVATLEYTKLGAIA
jgi:hypothetical protein